MRASWIGLIIAIAGTASAAADETANGTTVVSIPGKCMEVLVSDRQESCKPQSPVIYSMFANGVVMFNVMLPNHRVMAFVGNRVQQPRPEEYWLYLSRVRIANGPNSSATDVDGKCKMVENVPGTVISSIECMASDARGRSSGLRFKGNGQRVNVHNY